ncbi:DUF4350 domain-containing protein [Nostoc sp. TCL26-01]|uniref:DUF4350 domain-containing protein n=1 Tax=Nostoc sp. TCL26-01 TaxID=2576904 RepID=UPI0015BF5CAD|nr:DUF4350 domain-containing protein [Nostoc sp. TCL26-01]QLE56841.1 DUF4350 domain-containing protein [Nostoc sp. TCL26-01]
MKRSNRLTWLGAIALVVVIILTFITAPNTQIYKGSTYNRAADGYGAWYAFMEKQGTTMQRWQKPLTALKQIKSPVTLLQVYNYPREPKLWSEESEWVKTGNTLVILGVQARVSAAEFHTRQTSPVGDIKIDTRRRNQKVQQPQVLLGDRFGAVIWEEKYDQGKVIFATTPYLAANAYQDNLNNFKYLASLVKQKGHTLFVDEYIHGYKDEDVKTDAGEGDLIGYLAKTPIVIVLLQAGVLLLVLVWGKNRRFGRAIALTTPAIDNSAAYIQALAGVLHKAESNDFVVDIVGKEEQLQLQKTLGLGQILLEHQTLINIWTEKTGKSPTELDTVLKLQARKRRINQSELLNWLAKWRSLRNE